ncbi:MULTISPECIES: hypothetical protein [Thermodesulfovibrio]|uniref:hypothetical protein n=1 Tax=Thermodesulfovibrio yellowstonii TaxID=28262 RepID=UPI0004011027|nr:hypothetical protein [Thermodesulfovibrio islandicus]
MSKSTRQKVFELIKEYLKNKPQGANYAEILRFIMNELPDVPKNTITGNFHELRKSIRSGKEKEITMPDKGLYILTKFQESEEKVPTETKIKEEDFYDRFKDYLVNELEECTNAITLGRNFFGDKWSTPDVIGIYKFSEIALIKPPIEIISAEIKIDTSQLITAFGQACGYKIFSHKVYIVIPKEATEIPKLESLCMRFGIGLILFDKNNPEDPAFEIRTRAHKSEPDYFYVNDYIKKLPEEKLEELMR